MNFSEYLAKHGRAMVVDVGDHLFRQGDKDGDIYVVQSGFLKAYYLSEDGKERIKSFICPGDKISSLAANYGEGRCTFGVVCMQRAEIYVLDFDQLYQASRSDVGLSAELVDFLLGFGSRKELREYEFLCLSAQERYKRLLRQSPELAEMVTQNEIAQYLGVTPVGLSRIRKRLG